MATDDIETAGAPFPVVGIGASAGGLAAFEAFFSGMPPVDRSGNGIRAGPAPRTRPESVLTDLIRHYTPMPVFEAQDGMPVRPNCVYIIPPNHDMALRTARCNCSSRAERAASG